MYVKFLSIYMYVLLSICMYLLLLFESYCVKCNCTEHNDNKESNLLLLPVSNTFSWDLIVAASTVCEF